jgi:hypothetical protein
MTIAPNERALGDAFVVARRPTANTDRLRRSLATTV